MSTEIERKYLIRMPAESFLIACEGVRIWEIEQIYLTAEPLCTRRVRRVTENGTVTCYKTFKRRISALSAMEDEGVIPHEDYTRYVDMEADPTLKPILKTRYKIPYMGQILEFDIYPFWEDRAVLEIELESEQQQTVIPEWVEVIRDVTDDRRYKNVCLAAEIPMDEI